MLKLVHFFWQLALLRRRPQDLPGSLFLLQVLVLVNLGFAVLLGLVLYGSLYRVLGASLLELVLSGGLLYAGLQILGKVGRWRQAFSALLGISIIGSLVSMTYHAMAALGGMGHATAFLDLLVFLWLLTVMGHVVRHAFEIHLPVALLIVFLYTMLLLGLVAQWFPADLSAA